MTHRRRWFQICAPLLLAAVFGMCAAPGTKMTSDKPASDSVRLALMRSVPEKWNLDLNFQTFLTCADMAGKQKADVLITPECWLDGYACAAKNSTPERLQTIAQPLDTSPYLQQVSEKAKQYGMYICFGFMSEENGQLYNAAGLWDPTGERIGVYHKTHLQTHDLQYTPGEALPVWDTPWGPVGIMICADRRWPETARTLRLQGARLILNPTYGFFGDFNTAMMRTRAFENQCFIAFTHPKQGLITTPRGGVLVEEEGTDITVLISDIDLSQAKTNNHLADRRPDIYGIITERK